uniref:Protein sleepless n=1 Tax=Anopheles funestus TaxID=62324 RepID=A0A182RSC3_ANOFN
MNYISVLSILTAFFWLVQLADARKCYICGEGADGPFRTLPTHHGQSSVPTVEGTCEDFRPEEKYAFDCPPTYTSCLTQVDGEIEIRTCGESLAINDCKSANSIDYCYCSTDLCNQLTRTEIRRSIETALMHAHHRNRLGGGVGMHHQPPPNNSDDEDMAESSGMDGDRSETHRTISSSRSSSQQQPHHHDMLHNGGAIGAPGHRDVTTQITITLKPVATSADRRSKDNSATSDSNTTASDRSRESNAIPSTTSSSPSASVRLGSFIVSCCVLLHVTLQQLSY